MKLNEMGTTGLVDYATDDWRMRGLRRARAAKVIRGRYGLEAERRFHKAVSIRWNSKLD